MRLARFLAMRDANVLHRVVAVMYVTVVTGARGGPRARPVHATLLADWLAIVRRAVAQTVTLVATTKFRGLARAHRARLAANRAALVVVAHLVSRVARAYVRPRANTVQATVLALRHAFEPAVRARLVAIATGTLIGRGAFRVDAFGRADWLALLLEIKNKRFDLN